MVFTHATRVRFPVGEVCFFGFFSLSPCGTRLSRSDGDTRGQPTGSMAEWLRRLIRNQLGVARGSSNLSAVDFFFVSALVELLARGKKEIGAVRESNPRPLAPKARIIPLDQRPKHRCGGTHHFLGHLFCPKTAPLFRGPRSLPTAIM